MNPVGKVESKSDGGRGIPKLRDLEMEEYTSAEKLGKTRANRLCAVGGRHGRRESGDIFSQSGRKGRRQLVFLRVEESSDVELPLLGGGGVRSGHERIREKVREERRRFGEMSNAGGRHDAGRR